VFFAILNTPLFFLFAGRNYLQKDGFALQTILPCKFILPDEAEKIN